MAECEVKVWRQWQRLTLARAFELERGRLMRCPECHGQVRLNKETASKPAHFEHYDPNPGCSLGEGFSGTLKAHPWPLK